MCRFVIVYTFLFLLQTINKSNCDIANNEVEHCDLPLELKREIASYASIAEKIINATVNGRFKGTTYNRLAEFVDKYGYRYSPSENLENAIDYMINKSIEHGLDNVHGETVTVPNWIRGKESAEMLQPHPKQLAMLGLGGSVGTPPERITAEAVVVSSFEELDKIGAKVKGKIVVYAQEFKSYGETVQYRSQGASRASKYGAVATLIRSITPFSLNTPHTGHQEYAENITKIPTACITVEDAHLLQRIYNRGSKIVINLKMEAYNGQPKTSRNTVAEIKGRTMPEKIVIISGHMDSWDVGQGAMDDGGGMMLSWNSLVVLKELGLQPKRTIRAILWTAEESGLVGAFAYYNQHKNEIKNFNIVLESDEGTFNPHGLQFSGTDQAACIVQEVLKLLQPINTTQLRRANMVGSDITVFVSQGVPGASLLNDNDQYFWYHHTEADMLDVEDPVALDKGLALWATASYILADLNTDIPRK